MEWINDYHVSKTQYGKIISGNFGPSAGEFTVEYSGDGGNADEYKITLSGGQFDMDGKPTVITIVGCWELNEVAELFNLIKKVV